MKNSNGFGLAMVALALGLTAGTGCATTSTETRSGFRTTYTTRTGIGVHTPPAPVRHEASVPGMVPPARAIPDGPPQDFAWLYSPPYGCEHGPLSLQISNTTGYFLTVMIDGRVLRVRAADGEFPHVPPGETAYLCLSGPGTHVISGIAFAARYGELTEIDRFRTTQVYTVSSLGGGTRHGLTINDMFLRWH